MHNECRGQDTARTLRFSLAEAQEYAGINSPVIKNAGLDIEAARKKIWETTAAGLPQVNAKYSWSYMLTVPENIKQFSSFSSLGNWMYGADQGLDQLLPNQGFGYIPVPSESEQVDEKDLKWNSTLDITATQLIFSGAYIVGLQTAKTFRNLSELMLTRSESELRKNVFYTYCLVLVAEENKKVIDTTYSNTEKLKYKMIEMHKQGFIEETDIDQMTLSLNYMNDTRMMLARQTEIARNLLKFQIGAELTAEIELTDNLTLLLGEPAIGELLQVPFNPTVLPEVMLLEKQKRLGELSIRYHKSTFLPDIAAYYTHQENFNDKSFSFTPPDLLGLVVNIPIFGSGLKNAKIQQAKIELSKTANTINQTVDGLNLEYMQTRSALETSLDKLKTNRENVLLADKIRNRTLIKYKQGLSSSTELTQASNQYLDAQAKYYNSMLEVIDNKAKLEKLLNIR